MTNYPMTYDFWAKAIFAASAQMLIFSMCLHMWEPDPPNQAAKEEKEVKEPSVLTF